MNKKELKEKVKEYENIRNYLKEKIENIFYMSKDELRKLGFMDVADRDLMLMPLWCYELLPDGIVLAGLGGKLVVKGADKINTDNIVYGCIKYGIYPKDDIIEKLAEIEHNQWYSWAKSVCNEVDKERRERWENYFIPYDLLDEDVKDKDREFVREIIKCIKYNRDEVLKLIFDTDKEGEELYKYIIEELEKEIKECE